MTRSEVVKGRACSASSEFQGTPLHIARSNLLRSSHTLCTHESRHCNISCGSAWFLLSSQCAAAKPRLAVCGACSCCRFGTSRRGMDSPTSLCLARSVKRTNCRSRRVVSDSEDEDDVVEVAPPCGPGRLLQPSTLQSEPCVNTAEQLLANVSELRIAQSPQSWQGMELRPASPPDPTTPRGSLSCNATSPAARMHSVIVSERSDFDTPASSFGSGSSHNTCSSEAAAATSPPPLCPDGHTHTSPKQSSRAPEACDAGHWGSDGTAQAHGVERMTPPHPLLNAAAHDLQQEDDSCLTFMRTQLKRRVCRQLLDSSDDERDAAAPHATPCALQPPQLPATAPAPPCPPPEVVCLLSDSSSSCCSSPAAVPNPSAPTLPWSCFKPMPPRRNRRPRGQAAAPAAADSKPSRDQANSGVAATTTAANTSAARRAVLVSSDSDGSSSLDASDSSGGDESSEWVCSEDEDKLQEVVRQGLGALAVTTRAAAGGCGAGALGGAAGGALLPLTMSVVGMRSSSGSSTRASTPASGGSPSLRVTPPRAAAAAATPRRALPPVTFTPAAVPRALPTPRTTLLPPRASNTTRSTAAAPPPPPPSGGRGASRTAGRVTVPPPGVPPVSLAAAPARRASAPARKAKSAQDAFLKSRPAIAQQLYDKWNSEVFGGRLPVDLPVVWNSRLVSTAGQVLDDGSHNDTKLLPNQKIPCRLELSTKILTTMGRLRNTLAHEMCHVAAWLLEEDYDAPHGPAFWKWAQAFMEHDAREWAAARGGQEGGLFESGSLATTAMNSTVGAGGGWGGGGGGGRRGRTSAPQAAYAAAPAASHSVVEGVEGGGGEAGGDPSEDGPLVITRMHNFETHMPYRWQCSNTSCNKLYQRHRCSIDTARHVCSKCKGRLVYLGKFHKDGHLLKTNGDAAGTEPRTPKPGGGSSRQRNTTPVPLCSNAPGNAYRNFVKEKYADVKQSMPHGTPSKEVMKRLAEEWQQRKAAALAEAAAAIAAEVGDDTPHHALVASLAPGGPYCDGGGVGAGGAGASTHLSLRLPPGVGVTAPAIRNLGLELRDAARGGSQVSDLLLRETLSYEGELWGSQGGVELHGIARGGSGGGGGGGVRDVGDELAAAMRAVRI